MDNKTIHQKTATQKSIIYIAAAVVIFALAAYFPVSESFLTVDGVALTREGRISVAALIFCLILWLTEAMPFHITGFLGMLLLAFQGIASFSSIINYGFGNQIIVFFIGVLCISSFITRSGLGKRLCLLVLSITGNSTKKIILGFLTAGTLLSMWVTDVAVAAILMPLAKTILEEQGLKPLESNCGRALMIACAWGPLIGGIGTPAGCGPNPIAIGFVKEMAGIEISFLDWMCYGVPTSLALIIPAWLILTTFFKPEISHLSKTKEELKREYKQLPSPDREEKITLVVFVLTVLLWITSDFIAGYLGIEVPTAMPAIIGACLFFFPGVSNIQWREIQNEISWDSILLTVTGISLGMIIYDTGAALWLSQILLGGIVNLAPILQILLIILMVSILKVGLSSNTVTATVIIPIIIAMATSNDLSVMGIVIPASLTLSLAFILVTSTPTSVIPYSSGYFRMADMAKTGILMTVASSLIMAVMIYGIGMIRGLY